MARDISVELRALGINVLEAQTPEQMEYDQLLDIGDVDGEMLIMAADEIQRLRDALKSIATNSCCDRCQEAALVAKHALRMSE